MVVTPLRKVLPSLSPTVKHPFTATSKRKDSPGISLSLRSRQRCCCWHCGSFCVCSVSVQDYCLGNSMNRGTLTLCNSMDCSPPSSSVYGILQARILEWVSISSYRRSFRPRDCTCSLCLPHWQANSLQLEPPERP